MPAAGQRPHRIVLEEPITTLVSGESSTTWVKRAARWARIEPLDGRELWRARQVQADVTHKVVLPWESSLRPTTTWRLLFEGRVLQLLSVIRPLERRIEWELLAKEAV